MALSSLPCNRTLVGNVWFGGQTDPKGLKHVSDRWAVCLHMSYSQPRKLTPHSVAWLHSSEIVDSQQQAVCCVTQRWTPPLLRDLVPRSASCRPTFEALTLQNFSAGLRQDFKGFKSVLGVLLSAVSLERA